MLVERHKKIVWNYVGENKLQGQKIQLNETPVLQFEYSEDADVKKTVTNKKETK